MATFRDEMPEKVRFSELQWIVCRSLSIYRSATFAAWSGSRPASISIPENAAEELEDIVQSAEPTRDALFWKGADIRGPAECCAAVIQALSPLRRGGFR